MTTPPLEEYQTKKEFCESLAITERTADRWDKLGIGPPRTKLSKHVLYRKTAVADWLRSKEQKRGV